MANTMKPSHIWKRTRIIPCHLSCWLLLIRTAATVPKRSTRPRRWRTLMIPVWSRPWLSRPSVPATRIQPAAEASRAAKSNSNAGSLVPCLCDALVLTLGTEKPSPATHEHDGRTGWRYSGRSLCLLRPYSCPPSLLSLRDSYLGFRFCLTAGCNRAGSFEVRSCFRRNYRQKGQDCNGTLRAGFGKLVFGLPAPEGATHHAALTASLKRCPDTNRCFSVAC